MRNDDNLHYVYKGEQTGLRGRPKVLDGKIKMHQIDKRKIKFCYQDEAVKVYEGIVYSKSLKRTIKLSYVEFWDKGVYTGQYAVLFSTDLQLSAYWIYIYYKSRIQIEFLQT